MNESASFVGRRKELSQLRDAYSKRRHVLIIGAAGVGKSALLRRARQQFPLLLCEETSSLRRIFESLERQFGWSCRKMNVIERKNRLLPYLARRAETVALDSVALTPPRLAGFIYNLIERVPVWISCRSVQPKEIGAVWQYLSHFEHIDLGPLARSETAMIIQSAINAGRLPASTKNYISILHRIARGNPRTFEELLIELSTRDYHLDNAFERDLLDLDRRIHHTVDLVATQRNCQSGIINR
jgi:hypothetical protein